MGLFKRKKKKEVKTDEFLEEIEFEENISQGKRGIEHQSLGYCEQIREAARELEETKKEYRIVTDYLRDVQIIEDLPERQRKQLQDTAKHVKDLTQAREAYVKKGRGISDVQFNQMEQLEEVIPKKILKLEANEKYQAMVKRDMDYLEGEKGSLIYQIETKKKEEKFLKIGLFIILGLFICSIIGLLILQSIYRMDLMLSLLIAAFITAVLGSADILWSQNSQKKRKQAEANLNRVIILLNRMKAKYVNVTNAVDYACEKYHARNSMELRYIWEQYLEEVKEREKYEKANDEFDHYSKELIRELKSYKLYDASIWVRQTNAILDKKEMVELKHYLLVRRQKLRKQLEHNSDTIKNAKKQIQLLLKNNGSQIQDMVNALQAIDNLQ